MTSPPMGQDPPQLWMTVSDVFQIRGRGTVVTGRLEGNGLLGLGDAVLCDGMRWQVSAIEQFRATLATAEPGSDIGILLANGPASDVLRGRTLYFAPDYPTGPSLSFGPVISKKKRWRS